MTHPTIDVLTDRVAVVMQHRPVVPFTSWMADALRVCTDTERGLQILTPAHSRLTMPLRLVLDGPDSRWVVTDPAGGYFDGLSGTTLAWDGSAFSPVREAGQATLADSFATAGGPAGVQLLVTVTVRHPPTETLTMGGVAQLLCEALTGCAPAGWGTSEPAGTPWRPEQLTRLCRERAPQPTWLVYVGDSQADHPAIGTLQITRVTSGVEENTTLAVGLPARAATPDLVAVAGRIATEHPLVSLLAQAVPGRTDLTVQPRWSGLPAPIGLAIGGDTVDQIGSNRAFTLPDAPGRRIGPSRSPGAWYELGDGFDPQAWTRFQQVMAHLRGTGHRPLADGGKAVHTVLFDGPA